MQAQHGVAYVWSARQLAALAGFADWRALAHQFHVVWRHKVIEQDVILFEDDMAITFSGLSVIRALSESKRTKAAMVRIMPPNSFVAANLARSLYRWKKARALQRIYVDGDSRATVAHDESVSVRTVDIWCDDWESEPKPKPYC